MEVGQLLNVFSAKLPPIFALIMVAEAVFFNTITKKYDSFRASMTHLPSNRGHSFISSEFFHPVGECMLKSRGAPLSESTNSGAIGLTY